MTSEELLELAVDLMMPDDALDEEITDATMAEMLKQRKALLQGILLDRIEYLMSQGYHPDRLAQIIRDSVAN